MNSAYELRKWLRKVIPCAIQNVLFALCSDLCPALTIYPPPRHVPRSQNIQDPWSCRILDLIGFIFSWDPRGLGSCHGNIAVWSKGSWMSDRQDFARSWGSCIQPEQVVVRSCRSWILHNNNVTVFWPSFTSNEILLLVPHTYALLKLEHC